MNANDLEALQAPLKGRYKADPGAALITLRAKGRATDGVACKVATARSVTPAQATSASSSMSVTAEGDLDFRGTLGVSKDVPVGFERIRLAFALDTDASEEQLATLIRLTERHCVVYQTLRAAPEITVSRRVVGR
jgi:uncharacterized OsmC-like protein